MSSNLSDVNFTFTNLKINYPRVKFNEIRLFLDIFFFLYHPAEIIDNTKIMDRITDLLFSLLATILNDDTFPPPSVGNQFDSDKPLPTNVQLSAPSWPRLFRSKKQMAILSIFSISNDVLGALETNCPILGWTTFCQIDGFASWYTKKKKRKKGKYRESIEKKYKNQILFNFDFVRIK